MKKKVLFTFLICFLSLSLKSKKASAQSVVCSLDALQTTLNNQQDIQYIFFGENHKDLKVLDFFKEALPFLKSHGFDYFFAEYIDSSDQNFIDEINLEKPRLSYPQFHFLFYDFGYSFEKYVDITKAVLENNYNLKGLDKRKDLSSVFPGDKKNALRDLHMSQISFDFVSTNPTAKIIFFNGSDHSYDNKNPKGESFFTLFKEKILSSKIVNIKFDYSGEGLISPQRIQLNRLTPDKIELNCPSKTFIYQDSLKNPFNFYIFKDNQKAFPPYAGSNSIQI